MTILTLVAGVLALAGGCGGRRGPVTPDAHPGTAPTKQVASAGSLQGSIQHDGRRRTYLVYRPARLAGQQKVPLVIALHGGYGEAGPFAQTSGFNSVADRHGFLVVYPNGVDRHWADGRDPSDSGVDDVAFIDALIEHLVSTQSADPDRVYVTGHSNGGTMTLRLACELSGRIAAFASVAANFPEAYGSRCAPRNPVPILLINGTEDRFMPWSGGAGKGGRLAGDRGSVWSTLDTVQFWARADGCAAQPLTTLLPDVDPSDGMRVEQRRYSQCRAGVEVISLAVQGGGHTWPGTEERSARQMLTGRPTQDIDGAEEIWRFFSRY